MGKTREIFNRLSPSLAGDFDQLREHGNLDLESRKGKQPGGYLMPLEESRQPFIFMNAVGRDVDLRTLVHEGGHAIQSFLYQDLELTAFKEYPMEIAEVASMSMELFSMDYWDVFFDNKQELRRAKEYK